MKRIDMRFDSSILKEWIGKEFIKYKCDAFEFTNSVTQIVGLYIGNDIFAITNIQEPVDYYGFTEDIAVGRLSKAKEEDIKSAFKDVEMVSAPIEDNISSITLVNECQRMYKDRELTYEVWLTRAIIIEAGGLEISFEKDTVPFSEEIIIQRGRDLAKKRDDNDDFLQEWDEGYSPEYTRDIVIINETAV